ncbi:MAG TPA: hypothetical protein VHB79_34200 [Polyangiaceae bacterium]|nr:hypothetical protein [Polyangiaceae bacterium]
MKYLACILFAWLMVGCLPAGSTMTGPALVHPNFPYAVTYDDERDKSLMGPEWDLETHRKRAQTQADAPVELERKKGNEVGYRFDFDDDDGTDAKVKLPMPDLVLVNRKTSARLEVATLLLDKKLADKELRVLLNQVIENGSGTRSLTLGFDKTEVTKRLAARLLDSEEAALGDQKGLVATIERVDLDQLQANPKAVWRRSRLLLMHAPFEYYAFRMVQPPSGSDPTNAANQPQKEYHSYKVLLMVEYSNAVEDFEPQYPEFLRLLGKIHLMNDDQFASYLGTQIARCSSDHSSSSSVDFAISDLGAVSIDKSKGFDSTCLSSAVSGYTFAATGQDHKVSATFDMSKPVATPEWLTKSGYREQRPAAATEPAAPAAPEAPPSDAAPAPEAPAAAAPQPGGDSSPPSSSANSPESGSSSKP